MTATAADEGQAAGHAVNDGPPRGEEVKTAATGGGRRAATAARQAVNDGPPRIDGDEALRCSICAHGSRRPPLVRCGSRGVGGASSSAPGKRERESRGLSSDATDHRQARIWR
jgi:hypothetical protein